MAPTPFRAWVDGDAGGEQVVRIADARQLQDLRRLHRAGAEQHLGVGEDLAGLAVLDELHADRAAVLDQDAGGARADLGGQVRPLPAPGAERRRRRAPALAVLDGQLVGPEALLLEAVEVVGAAVAGLRRRPR